jgi:hypothetical protein
MAKPVIYCQADMTDFLNDYEKNYFQGSRNDEVIDSIKERALIFLELHRNWMYYDAKNGVLVKIGKIEWEKKARTTLQLQYHLKKETINMMLGQYFTKVDLPKGGIEL